MSNKAKEVEIIQDEDMSEEEMEQEALVNILLHLTNTELKEANDNELNLNIRLADLANIAKEYMKLLKQLGEIQKAAKEAFEE
jgi:hypothetical protein